MTDLLQRSTLRRFLAKMAAKTLVPGVVVKSSMLRGCCPERTSSTRYMLIMKCQISVWEILFSRQLSFRSASPVWSASDRWTPLRAAIPQTERFSANCATPKTTDPRGTASGELGPCQLSCRETWASMPKTGYSMSHMQETFFQNAAFLMDYLFQSGLHAWQRVATR